MIEEEWRSSTDPQAMCEFIRTATTSWKTRWLGWMKTKRFQVSDRKWRLVELARVEQNVYIPMFFRGVGALILEARRHARDDLPSASVTRASAKALSWLMELQVGSSQLSDCFLVQVCQAAAALARLFSTPPHEDAVIQDMAALVEERAARLRAELPNDSCRNTLDVWDAEHADMVRDVLGHLFVADSIAPAWLAANDGAASGLVEAIDASGEYRDMPVLADALEDAGCASDAILSHCRQPTRHVRGCWVVDRLLGRE
jgi:hypothetical protein